MTSLNPTSLESLVEVRLSPDYVTRPHTSQNVKSWLLNRIDKNIVVGQDILSSEWEDVPSLVGVGVERIYVDHCGKSIHT